MIHIIKTQEITKTKTMKAEQLECDLKCRKCGNPRLLTMKLGEGMLFKSLIRTKLYWGDHPMELECSKCEKETLHDFTAFELINK